MGGLRHRPQDPPTPRAHHPPRPRVVHGSSGLHCRRAARPTDACCVEAARSGGGGGPRLGRTPARAPARSSRPQHRRPRPIRRDSRSQAAGGARDSGGPTGHDRGGPWARALRPRRGHPARGGGHCLDEQPCGRPRRRRFRPAYGPMHPRGHLQRDRYLPRRPRHRGGQDHLPRPRPPARVAGRDADGDRAPQPEVGVRDAEVDQGQGQAVPGRLLPRRPSRRDRVRRRDQVRRRRRGGGPCRPGATRG